MTNTKVGHVAASLLCSVVGLFPTGKQTPDMSTLPQYTDAGQLKLPEHYREWVYLTTGFDMSYTLGAPVSHHMFDNVFVNPESYRVFLDTGIWPDKTTFVLETRSAREKGSINQRGNFQSTDVMGLEIHLKNNVNGGWRFYSFDGGHTAAPHPVTDICTTCHAAHGAVDNTFTQFYPTLLPIAQAHYSLSENYMTEESARKPE